MSVIQDVLKVVVNDLNARSFGFMKETVETGINLEPNSLKILNAQHNGFIQALNIVGEAVNWFANNATESSLPESFVVAGNAARANQEAAAPNADADAESLDPITVSAPSSDTTMAL